MIAGNLELAALIHRFRTDDVVPFKEVPSFNPRRRMSMASMRHSMSSSSVMHLMASAGDNASSIGSSSTTGSSGTPSPTLVYSRPLMLRRQAPSPSPSQSHWLDHSHLQFSNSSTVSVRSDTGSSCTAESEDGNGSSLTDKISVDQCDVVSDSSGVGTSNSGSGGSYDANRPHSDQQQSLVLPGMAHLIELDSSNYITYPDCLSIETSSNLEYFGYVVIPKVPKLESVVLKINGVVVPANGWTFMSAEGQQILNIKMAYNGYPNTPVVMRQGYMLKLKSDYYYKSGDNVEVVYVPESN